MAKTYSEKLRDPRWQKKRLLILERDEWQCQLCYDKETMLVVHHRYYTPGAEPWEYPDEALVVLCDNCHQEEHEMVGVFQNLKQALGKAGAFTKDIHDLSVVFYDSPILNEPDWSIIEEELKMLLRSKKERGKEWDDAHARAAAVWKEKAAKIDGKG